jgi:predicted metal-dependent hydrolase
VIRNERRSVLIQVHPDKSIVVKAPNSASQERLDNILAKRYLWILKQQQFFQKFEPRANSKAYFLGESHMYLGRQYRLKFLKVNDRPCVKLQDGYFKVFSDDRDPVQIHRLISQWYREKAERIFSEILENCVSRFKKYKIAIPKLRIQKMKKRWGSYSTSNVLRLNLDLIKTCKACIRYVIIHELCHAIHPNHSRRFYELLKIQMHDWEKWKQLLEEQRL